MSKQPETSKWTFSRLATLACICLLLSPVALARQLVGLELSRTEHGDIRVQLALTENDTPTSLFASENPPRLTLDLANTQNQLGWRNKIFNQRPLQSVIAGESEGTTRLVFNLDEQVRYEQKETTQGLVLLLQPTKTIQPTMALEQIVFEPGENGSARLKLQLSGSGAIVDVHHQNNQLQLDLLNVTLPKQLQKEWQISERGNLVQSYIGQIHNFDTRLLINTNGLYEHSIYQMDKLVSIDIKPIMKSGIADGVQFYTGKKLSLNYAQIEIRNALQFIADFSGQNFVISDGVKGSISLRLNSIPWDQALDLILKTKGLAKRLYGDTLLIAPQTELANQEEVELRNYNQRAQLMPMNSELIRIKYAKAENLAKLLKSRDNTLLSSRGSISVDLRTNSLLIRDSIDHLKDIKKLVEQLDIPIQQVMIESRVVIAEDTFVRDLGARLGVRSIRGQGSSNTFVAGNAAALGNNLNAASFGNDMAVNLPASPIKGTAASIALGFLNADSLLDLELSALQAEGRGDVVSNPRIVTSNQQRAVIEQGVELPYQESTSSGATAVTYRKAVMSLAVTPQITPDNQVILDLVVNKDSRGEDLAAGVAINTRELQTQVLVNDGETVVLGGIYETEKSKSVSKVPLLGDIPFLGALFRSTTEVNNKNELLVFVTPKILHSSSSE